MLAPSDKGLMRTIAMPTHLLVLSILLLSTGNAFAHAGPFQHMETHHEAMHLLIHTGMTVGLGMAIYFLSRWFMTQLSSPKRRKWKR